MAAPMTTQKGRLVQVGNSNPEMRGTMPRIEAVWAVLMTDPDGDEAMVCGRTMDGTVRPLMATEEQSLRSVLEYARHEAKRTGHPARLVKFYAREDIEDIKP